MLGLLDLIHRKEARVVVIATSQNRQQLNKALLQSRGTHVFDKTLEITPPTLVSIIQLCCSLHSSHFSECIHNYVVVYTE